MTGVDIVVLAGESGIGIGLLAANIVMSRKLKKLRDDNKVRQEQMQRNALDEMLKNSRRR